MSGSDTPIAVTSRSFSRHPVLRQELQARYRDVAFNDLGVTLAGDELVEFLAGKEKAITSLETIDGDIVSRLPDLKVISKVGVGVDMIDVEAVQRQGIELRYASGTNSRSVAELVIGFAISLLRHVLPANQMLREGKWGQPKGSLLSAKTVGILGLGHVGSELARLLQPFNCRVLYHDKRQFDASSNCYQATAVGFEDLLVSSDILSIHLDLNTSTRQILNAARLQLLKPNAILINTSRGDLVDEAALKEMLQNDQLAGAAFDVFACEPPEDLDLLNLPNFLATPHIGGSTEEAILAMGRAAIDGLA